MDFYTYESSGGGRVKKRKERILEKWEQQESLLSLFCMREEDKIFLNREEEKISLLSRVSVG